MINKSRFLQTGGALLMSVLFAACSQDEVTPQDTSLPEGKYPLVLTAEGLEVTATPAEAGTRSTVDGDWEGVTEVAVRVDGRFPMVYKVEPSAPYGTATLSAADGETPFYWQSATSPINVEAWYPYDMDPDHWYWKVKSDQSDFANYRASDRIKGQLEMLTFNDRNRSMTFYHHTAKVVIKLTSEEKGFSLENAEVRLLNITGVESGTTIKPYCHKEQEQGQEQISYLALLNGQTINENTNFIQVTANGIDFYYKPAVAKELQGGTVYTYNITVQAKGLSVSVGESMSWGTGNSGEGSAYLD